MQMNDMILLSVDDHIVEPPTVFDNQLTAKQRETAPQLRHVNGADNWYYGGVKMMNVGLNAVAGRPPEEYGLEPTALDGMRQGCWDIEKRIGDMDVNGILGSLCFGTLTGMDGTVFLSHANHANKDDALIHLQAYNNWHIDEWAGAHPDRFIPLAVLPLWDVNEMVKEIERVAKKGCHAISFPDNPKVKGLPSLHDRYWEPFWAAAADHEMVINCHIGSGNQPAHPSPESPIEVWTTCMPMAIALGAADWLYLDALKRYPLKIALSEGGIGWIPYLTERADFTNARHKAWTNSSFGDKKPSEVFREHFYSCFIDDVHGLENIDKVGEDNIFYECDYPHSDSLWPESPEFLHASLTSLTDEQINKITHLNVMKAYKFDPFKHRSKADSTVGALRAKAKADGIDITPLSRGSAARPVEKGATRVVTSGDVMKLFMPPEKVEA